LEKKLILVHGALEWWAFPLGPRDTPVLEGRCRPFLFLPDGTERVIGRRNAVKLAQTA
jgi:hypothetical protein